MVPVFLLIDGREGAECRFNGDPPSTLEPQLKWNSDFELSERVFLARVTGREPEVFGIRGSGMCPPGETGGVSRSKLNSMDGA